MLLIILLSMVVGGLCTIIFQIILFYSYVRNQPFIGHVRKPLTLQEKAKIPKDLGKYQDMVAKKESLNCLNFVLAFLFSELRDTERLRRWIVKKMNVEFDELLQSKTLGRVIEGLTVRDYSLGPQLPIFKNATLLKAKPSDMDLAPEELDIGLEVVYNGGFRLAVDADLVFGKSVYVCITLKHLKGNGRLQFTRHPFTHWSFAFFTEPEMEFEIESQFEGRVVSQLGSLIINQIRRSVRKKHTLPNYKIRYKPFFVKPEPPHLMDDVVVNDAKITIGKMDVTVVECSRLPILPVEAEVFCTLGVDSSPYKEKNGGPKSSQTKPPFDTVEVEIQRGNKSLPLGTLFKQEMSGGDDIEELVVLETITPSSPASSTELKRGDVLVAIDGGKVTSMKAAAKLIKQAGEKVMMKVRRPIATLSDDINMPETLYAEESVTIRPDEDVAKKQDSKDDDDYVNITIKKVDTAVDGQASAAASSSSPEVEESLAATIKQKVTSSPMMIRRKLQGTYGVLAFTGKSDEEKEDKGIAEMGKGVKHDDNRYGATDERAKLNAPVARDNSKEGRRNGESKQESTLQVKDGSGVTSRRGSSTSIKDMHSDGETGDIGRDVTDGSSVTALFSKLEDINNSDIRKTSDVPAMIDPAWDEVFHFDVYDNDQYLNVCVMGKGVIAGKPDKETMISYISIPLMNTALHCLATSSGEYMQTYHLQPPERRAGSSRRGLYPELAAHRGFEEALCYGDIMLLFHYMPDPSMTHQTREEVEGRKRAETLNEMENKTKKPTMAAENKQPDENVTKKINITKEGEGREQIVNSTEHTPEASCSKYAGHDWLPTQFFSPTRCDLCTKKVWTKNAFQCRVCAMICHRKCVEKAQAQTYCTKEGARRSSTNVLLAHANKSKDADGSKDAASPTHVTKSPRSSPKLLPRSLQRQKRLLGRKIAPETSSDNEGSDTDSMAGSARSLKSQLLQTYGAQTKPGDADALVVAAAKEMGKELFSNLPFEERTEKLNAMISKLQHEIDQESETRTDMFKEEKQCTDPKEKAKLNAQINKSDERLQALALLMLHYCAGLNDCTEQMERDKLKLEQLASTSTEEDLHSSAAEQSVPDRDVLKMEEAQAILRNSLDDVEDDEPTTQPQNEHKHEHDHELKVEQESDSELESEQPEVHLHQYQEQGIQGTEEPKQESEKEPQSVYELPATQDQEQELKSEQMREFDPEIELGRNDGIVFEAQEVFEDEHEDDKVGDYIDQHSHDTEDDEDMDDGGELFHSIQGGILDTFPDLQATGQNEEMEVQRDRDVVEQAEQQEDLEETVHDNEDDFKDDEIKDDEIKMMDDLLQKGQ